MVSIPLNFRTRDQTQSSQSNALTTKPAIAAAKDRKTFAIYLIAILMYTVANPGPDPDPDPDHDPNPRGGGQLPNSTRMGEISGGASPHLYI